jgi:hypothetical protein
VWPQRRRMRMRQLEQAVAEAKASQADLMRRLELFEKIAAAAGADLRDPPAEVPQPLITAAQDSREDAPVRLEVGGREFIAVLGGEGGDPREWWAAIQHLASGTAP